jgi:hypothetical protein
MRRNSLGKIGIFSVVVTLGWHGAAAVAKNPGWELVPPPPPTPVLNVPPAPIMLPYSYAENPGFSTAVLPPNPTPSPFPPPIIHPKPQPQPQPQPRPIGVRPANAPNLNTVYALAHGFGTPRFGAPNYGPGAVEAFPSVPPSAPVNTWFDSSLRWYAQHVNAQQFYNEMAARPEYGIPNSGYAAASGMYEGVLPRYEYQAPQAVSSGAKKHHKSKRYNRHAHRVVATR